MWIKPNSTTLLKPCGGVWYVMLPFLKLDVVFFNAHLTLLALTYVKLAPGHDFKLIPSVLNILFSLSGSTHTQRRIHTCTFHENSRS